MLFTTEVHSGCCEMTTPAAPFGVHCPVVADRAGMKLKDCGTQDLSCLFL